MNKSRPAIILAAGYSSRMKAFKSTLDIDGKTAVQGLIDEIKGAGFERILLVTGWEREKLEPYLDDVVEEVYNKDFDKGMMSSIKAGLCFLENEIVSAKTRVIEGAYIFPVDVPLVKKHVIVNLAEEIEKDFMQGGYEKSKFAVPTYKGKKGHPLYIPSRFFEEILSYEGGNGVKAVTYKNFNEMIYVDGDDERVLLDMDTPKSYENILYYAKNYDKMKGIILKENLIGKRVFLVRHGSIIQHKDKIFLGQTDVNISNVGEEEIKVTSEKLKEYNIKTDRIYTSSLKRASQSAEIIKNELCFKEIISDDGLKEMALGEWDGKLISEIKENFPVEYKLRGENILRYKPLGKSENFYDLRYRVEKSLQKIFEKDNNEDIVIVSHKGVIKIIKELLQGEEMKGDINELITKKESKSSDNNDIGPLKNGQFVVLA